MLNNADQSSFNITQKDLTYKNERDFYFSKLKDIDHLLDVCTENKTENLILQIKNILYSLPN